MAAIPQLYTQRDVNCLSDPDKNTRKRALEKILGEVKSLSKQSDSVTAAAQAQDCQTVLSPLILKCFADPTEKCRELSVTLASELLPLLSNPAPFAAPTIRAIRDRIGGLQPAE